MTLLVVYQSFILPHEISLKKNKQTYTWRLSNFNILQGTFNWLWNSFKLIPIPPFIGSQSGRRNKSFFSTGCQMFVEKKQKTKHKMPVIKFGLKWILSCVFVKVKWALAWDLIRHTHTHTHTHTNTHKHSFLNCGALRMLWVKCSSVGWCCEHQPDFFWLGCDSIKFRTTALCDLHTEKLGWFWRNIIVSLYDFYGVGFQIILFFLV